jgi:hypothetical protein
MFQRKANKVLQWTLPKGRNTDHQRYKRADLRLTLAASLPIEVEDIVDDALTDDG